MGIVSQFGILSTAAALEAVLVEQGHKVKIGEVVAAARQVFAKAK